MNIPTLRNATVLGWGAALLMVLIGAGWQLATRAGARAELAPVDLALIRYLIPALLLAPVWLRTGLLPAHVGRWRLAFIIAGAGLPFGLLAMAGASLAPVAHMGALLPGASPILVVVLAWSRWGTRPGRAQVAGLGLVGIGLAGLGLVGIGLALATWRSWSETQGSSWLGDLLFIGAATLWALYTLALRNAGLSPWQSTALVSVWSALGVAPLWCLAFAGGMSLLPFASTSQLLAQVVWQGFVAGVAGLAVFGFAVKHIGPAAATSVGALVPSVVAIGGWVLLGEALDAPACLGVLAVVMGVWLASRAGVRQ